MYFVKNKHSKDYFRHQKGNFRVVSSSNDPKLAYKTGILFFAQIMAFLLDFNGFEGYIVVKE